MTANFYRTAFVVTTLIIVVFLSNPVEAARGEYCGKLPSADFEQPPHQAHTGAYLNAEYGYSVVIPTGLRGYVSAPGPERGFGVVLSWTPRAFLRVEAAYDAFFDITPEGVHRSDLTTIRLHDTVIDDQSSSFTLTKQKGARYLTRVRCSDDPQVYIHDQVIVMLNREIYRLDLQTVPERYSDDVKLLNQMLQSWRWQRPAAWAP